MFKEIVEATFGLFYVMTEGLDHDGSTQRTRLSVFLVLVDMGQVFRTITNPQFGWSKDSMEAISWIDIVYIVTQLLQQVIPRVVFFVVAVVLIIGALGDTFYVARIFKAGHVKNMLPVKVLRFLVGAIVTTLFTTVLEWVLYPMECLLEEGEYEEKSLSELLRGGGSACTPFASPEIAVTLPTIVITAIYIAYSLVTTLLSFEINPLSRNPWAHSTGRVEMLWTAVKVAAALLPFLSEFLSSVVVSIVLVGMSGLLLWAHVIHMPFHDLSTNVVRGGVYGGVLWLSLSSLIVSTYSADDDAVQQRQWILLAVLPVLFTATAVLVHQRQVRVVNFVHLLRGEFAALHQHNSPPQSQDELMGFSQDFGAMEHTMMTGDEDLIPKTVFDKFYDLDYERNRAFKTGAEALTVARAVLYSRKKADMPFLQYLVHRAIVENPECEELLIFQFLVQRFVSVQDQTQQAHKNRLSKLQNLALTIDNRYLLYAVNRRANQDFASAHLGKGAVSAINVMEFEGRMERARKAHLDCIVHMKAFWQVVRKSKREDGGGVSSATIEEMISRLGEFDKAIVSAGLEYEWLLEKYSGSVSMLTSYAHFCDAVLNDEAEAEKRRKQAELLENVTSGDGEDEDEEEVQKMEQAAASTATSDSESARQVAAKYMQSWSHIIMASEVLSLRTLTNRVRGLMLVLTITASAGYFFTSFYLFRDIAKKNILLIDKTGLFRAYAVGSCFLLRNQQLAAHRNETSTLAKLQGTLAGISESLRDQHKLNYEAVGGGELRHYYNNAELVSWTPVEGAATWRQATSTYWTLANDLARRIERASRTTLEEYNNQNFDPVVASPSKLSISYIVENSVRVLVPSFETVVAMYDEQVQDFGSLTSALVYSNASINALLVVGIAFFVLRALLNVIQTVQYKYISCWLALSMPAEAVKKLTRFYHDHEAMINDLESDEEKHHEEDDAGSEKNDKQRDAGPRSHPDDDHDARRRDDRDDYRRDDRYSGPPDDYHEGYRGYRSDPRERREEFDQDRREPRELDDHRRWRDGRGAQRDSFRSNGSAPYDGRGNGYRNRPRQDDEDGVAPRRTEHEDRHGLRGRGGRHDERPYDSHSGGYGEGRRGWERRAADDRLEQRVVGRHFGGSGGSDDEGERQAGPRSSRGSEARRRRGAAEEESWKRERSKKKEPEESEDEVEEEQRVVQGRKKGKRRQEEEEEEEEDVVVAPQRAGSGSAGGSKMKQMLKGMGGSFKGLSFNKGQSQQDILQTRFKAVEVTEETKTAVQHALQKKQAWFSRRPVYVASLSLMLGLCLFSILFPARVVKEITNLGPTTNQAGRRRYLTRACVHFSRELVLNDGFSRMTQAELHGALAWHLGELRESNRAVRLGDALGISRGADWRNEEHNQIMYDSGCPWRGEEAEEADCRLEGQAKVKINGLYSLLLNFYDAVEAVMTTYGVDPAEATAAYQAYLTRDARDVGPEFNVVSLQPGALAAIASDENLQFILAAFAGDVFQGLGATLVAFQHETAAILDSVQFESRLLYACYMVLVVVLFYGTLFRKTMQTAEQEAVKARGFVHKLPSYTLAKEETDVIREFFQHTLEHA